MGCDLGCVLISLAPTCILYVNVLYLMILKVKKDKRIEDGGWA